MVATGLAFSSIVVDPKGKIPDNGGGYYDIDLRFPIVEKDIKFTGGKNVQYTITGIPNLVAENFNLLSSDHGGNGNHYTAQHVQSIGNAGDSGWVTGTAAVHEPTSLLAAFSILAPAGLLFRRRK